MLDLRQVGIRIAVVHQRVQKLRRLPDALLALVQAEVLLLFGYHVVERLVLMIQPVELRDSGSRLLVILTKLVFALALPCSGRLENHPIHQYLSGVHWM